MAMVRNQIFYLVFCSLPFLAKACHETLSSSTCSEKGDAALHYFYDFAYSMVHEARKLVEKHKDFDGEEQLPLDCADVLRMNKSSGAYTIRPQSRVIQENVNVLCDMDDDGGGWTVIQRRGDFDSSADYFYRDWNSYKTGFGDINRDFWIGNDIIFALTNQRPCSLKFVLSDWEGNTTYAAYDEFWIDDEYHNYMLHVSGYRGTAGDSFAARHNEAYFSTKDRKNDQHDKSCAEAFKGAWWYTKCHSSNLNGQYLKGKHDSWADGVNWRSFRDHNYSLKDTYMKIRPRNFAIN